MAGLGILFIGMDMMKCDEKFYDKCSVVAVLNQDYAALTEIIIPVNVSMVSFLAIDVAKEYNRIEEQKKDKEVTNLKNLTLLELKEMAKANGVKGYSKMKKEELLEVLK